MIREKHVKMIKQQRFKHTKSKSVVLNTEFNNKLGRTAQNSASEKKEKD